MIGQPRTASAHPTGPSPTTVDELVQRARSLATANGRRILGIVGAPGAGKSTICAVLTRELGDQSVLVGMDGFHLADDELRRLGRRDRKGAPDTFDVGGYAALLERLRGQTSDVVYAPEFDRSLEASIGGAVAVRRDTPLVITEGNYLLYDRCGWDAIAGHLDEVWFLDVPADERRRRLVHRRRSHGDSLDQAEAWVCRVDEVNAAVVDGTRERADLIVHIDPSPSATDSIPTASADEGAVQ
ncbi:nucleoside/nucleotide kinase family protein [Tsukamurella soli]|uniref:Nucleoside/nucleotide kinase family protein n=1 Tax=Tsukamurella soli TaxID=644556 RepID=A0ABP8J901_9ACTN